MHFERVVASVNQEFVRICYPPNGNRCSRCGNFFQNGVCGVCHIDAETGRHIADK